VFKEQMLYSTAPPIERLHETAYTLLATAERCRRLATWITDRQAIEALLRLAEECEQRAEKLRDRDEP